MKTTSVHVLILLVIAGSIFLTSLGNSKLWDRDEPRNAGCAAEMMARGDWVVPTFNAQLRQQKPVLLYWLMISAYTVFGVNEFSARLWSAMLAIGTVLVTYGLARRLFNPTLALLAGVILATSIMFDVAARAATPDSVLIFFSTLAILFYVLGTFAKQNSTEHDSADALLRLKTEGRWFPQHWGWIVAMYVSMGFGVLAKGLVGAVLPSAIIGMFMLIYRLPDLKVEFWERQGWLGRTLISSVRPFHPLHFLKTVWAMRPLTAAALVLVVAAPWYVMVGVQTDGEFIRKFFLDEHLARATTAMENHRGGIWFYPLAILIGFFPWSVFWAPALVSVDRKLSKRDARKRGMETNPETVELKPTVLLLCWIAVQVGVFTIVKTKLPSYVTPCYPALAILTSALLYEWCQGRSRVPQLWFYGALVGLGVGGALMVGGLSVVSHQFMPDIWWIALAGIIPIVGAVLAILFLTRGNQKHSVVTFALTAFSLTLVMFAVGTVAVDSQQTATHVLDPIQDLPDEIPLASFNVLESSWVYYSGRSIHELSDQFASADPRSTESYLERNSNAIILTTDEHVEALKKRLPGDFEILRTTDYFLRESQILLLGKASGSTARLIQSPDASDIRVADHRDIDRTQSP